MDSIVWQLVLQLILIMLNAVFASAEIAVISMNDARLQKLADTGDKRAKRLVELTSQPARFLATIQVAITLSGFLGSAFAADNFSEVLVELIIKTGIPIPKNVLDSIAVILITIILSYFTLIFGELVPKRIAMKNSEKMALMLSGAVSGISKFFSPLVTLLTASTNGILKLIGIDPEGDDSTVTEEEIRMMVDEGREKGTIDADEKEFIQNVFDFDDMSADELATHRTELAILWTDETDEQWQRTIKECHHKMFPICDGCVDNVVGILETGIYFRLDDRSRDNVMKNAVHQPYFVPETIKADVLMANMRSNGEYLAVVIDEYGGLTGVITLHDLMWQLVGDFDKEELEKAKNDIARLDSKTWSISGSADIDAVESSLGMLLPHDDFDTFGGYVFSRYGSIPEDGAQFEFDADNLHIKVLKIKDHRILKTMVTVNEIDEEESKNDD